MTLELIRNEIYQQTGEPTDIDPSTDVQYNGGPLLTWVANEGQRAVASWKDMITGRLLRMRPLLSDLYFQSAAYIDQTLAVDAGVNSITFPAPLGVTDDQYNGWVVSTGTEVKLVTSYVGASRLAYVHGAWTSMPVTTDKVSIFKNFFYLIPSTHAWVAEHISLPAESAYLPTGNLLEILKVIDLESDNDISKARGDQSYPGSATSPGDPSKWWYFGNKLLFDVPIEDDDRWFKLEYFRLPSKMSADGDIAEIPEMFHYGICLWGIQWSYNRQGEKSAAYAAKRDFEEFMRKTKSTYEMEFERSEDAGTLQME